MSTPPPASPPPQSLLTPAEQLTYSTVRIACQLADGTPATGSGFFYGFLRDGDQHVPAIVTNKHVVRGAIEGSFSLTRQLEPLSIKPKVTRFGETTGRGYELAQFASAFARYTPSQTVTAKQTQLFSELGANQTVTAPENVTVQNAANPLVHKGCYGVTVCEGGPGEGKELVTCTNCVNFKQISHDAGECCDGHGEVFAGELRSCLSYLPTTPREAGSGRVSPNGDGTDPLDGSGNKRAH